MKTFLFTLILSLFLFISIYGQWTIQNTPTTSQLRRIAIIDTNNSWVVGYGGTILHTTNGGTDWILENSNTTEDLYSVQFPTNNNGFAFGDNGTFLKYINGQWTQQQISTNDNLYFSRFIDENTGWAAGFHEAVIKTTDGGNSWQNELLTHETAVASLCFINSNLGWAVSEYSFSDGTRYGILFKTTDGGNTWIQKFSVGRDPWMIYPGYLFISVFFINQNTGWIAGSNGLIYRTDDGGNTWNDQFAPTAEWLHSIFFVDQNQGWVVGDHGTIYKTTNGGYIWNQVYTGINDALLSVRFIDPNIGWIVGDNGRILHTTNGGNIWTIQNTPTTSQLRRIAIIDTNNSWVVGFGGTILHTTNGGTDWILENSNTTEDLYAIQFPTNNNGFAFGTNGTFLKYTDGQWVHQSIGINDDIYFSRFIDENTGWAAGFHEAVIKTTDGGNSWQSESLIHDNAVASLCFIDSNIGWIVTEYTFSDNSRYGILFKTTDGGSTWNQKFGIGGAPWNLPPGYLFISVYFINQNTGWIAGSNGLVFRTDDGGNTWNDQFAPTAEWLHSIFFVDQNHGWVVGDHGTIYKTTNGGYIWNQVYTGLNDALLSVRFIDPNIGWIVGDNGRILHTVNGGIPVELISFNADATNNDVVLTWITATEINNKGFEIQRRNKNEEFEKIGFVNGSGTTTTYRNYTYTDKNLSDVKYSYRLKQIDFDGISKYSNILDVEINVPLKFKLLQNYPNPFNPNTGIEFTLPYRTKVKLEVFNSLGQKVVTLVDDYLESGNHSVVFNASGLTSGIYYYRITANTFSEIKKMIFLK